MLTAQLGLRSRDRPGVKDRDCGVGLKERAMGIRLRLWEIWKCGRGIGGDLLTMLWLDTEMCSGGYKGKGLVSQCKRLDWRHRKVHSLGISSRVQGSD